ncbi:MAG: hypothetical protein M0T84_11085 [Betaproteobacteria bacterium]|nr:hypothetical protein [Betaproteobacteria bacterium]
MMTSTRPVGTASRCPRMGPREDGHLVRARIEAASGLVAVDFTAVRPTPPEGRRFRRRDIMHYCKGAGHHGR